MITEYVHDFQQDSWNSYIQKFQQNNVFHSSEWLTVLKDVYGYKPFAIKVSNPTVVLTAVKINSNITGNRIVSIAFSDFVPLLSKEVHSNYRVLMNKLIDVFDEKKYRYIELRCLKTPVNENSATMYFYHKIDLTSNILEVRQKLSSFRRRNINKAVREEVLVSFERELKAMKQFYRLHCKTRKRHSLPPQPFSFFYSVYENLIKKNMGIIAQATVNNRVIASHIYLTFGKKATYKYGASDDRFLHYRPNDLLMWSMIEEFSKNGFTEMSLGRTLPDNLGLLKYKRSWGSIEEKIYYERYSLETGLPITMKKDGSKFDYFKYLPIPILRLIGKIFYRHFG